MFRYRVKNMFGFSLGYSPEIELKSAKAPDTPSDVVTSIDGNDLKIEWNEPGNNYDTITRYEIEIKS